MAPSPVDPVRDAVGTAVGPGRGRRGDRRRPFKEVARQPWQQPRPAPRRGHAGGPELRPPQPARDHATDRNRLAEYDGLVRTARDTGYALVPSPGGRDRSRAVVHPRGHHRRRHRRRREAGLHGGQRRRPGRPRGPGQPQHRDRAPHRRQRLGRRGPTGLHPEDRLHQGPRRRGRQGTAGPRPGRRRGHPRAQGRRGLVGLRHGRPVRRRHPDRADRVGLQHPPAAVEAGGDRPVRRLQRPRPGRRRGAPRHPR